MRARRQRELHVYRLFCLFQQAKTSRVNFFQWLLPCFGWGKAGSWRQVPWNVGRCWRSVPLSQVPAVYRPLLPKCILRDTPIQDKAGSQDAQSIPCT